ncbi:MAG: hypothetical protein ACRDG3_04535, partial [Tepidiformaceae bacterium]
MPDIDNPRARTAPASEPAETLTRGSRGRQWTAIAAMAIVASPGIVLRFAGIDLSPMVAAPIFGFSILAAAFLLSWAAETSEMDISQG